MNAFSVVPGRRGERQTPYRRGGIGALGQTHTAPSSSAVESELTSRGYVKYTAPVVHHEPVVHTFTLSMSNAIKIAVDEALDRTGTPHSATHFYRAPRSGYPIPATTWTNIVYWVQNVAVGYMTGSYALPSWAQQMIHSGQISGLAGLGQLGHLGGAIEWLREHGEEMKLAGDWLSSLGDYLTAEDVKDTIKEIERKSATTFKTSDIPAFISMLQQEGFVTPQQAGTVAQGAQQAAAGTMFGIPTNMLLIGGIVLGIILLTRK